MDKNIRKTVLLSTSALARTLSPPFMISLKEAETAPDEKEFNKSHLPVAVLLEGKFPSAFRNRITSGFVKDQSFRVLMESKDTRMIVIADGDIIRNDVRKIGASESPLALGVDRSTGEVYGNRDFLVNCLNYLVDYNGIMELRSRELKMRLLDSQKIKKERLEWQVINTAGPVLIVILAVIAFRYFRKRKFTRN
jgi:gliding-associated putative ABC transporter substrate-binding component GldG